MAQQAQSNDTWKGFDEARERFKQWIVDSGKSEDTARTYWSRMKKFPIFSLYRDDTMELSGMLNKQLQSKGDVNALKQFLNFLHQEWEKDDIPDEEYEEYRRKKNAVQGSLELPETAKGDASLSSEEIKKKYIPTRYIYRMLKKAEPHRAKMWFVLYESAMRIGELRQTDPMNILEEHEVEPFGGIYIPEEISKSEKSRRWEFLHPLPLEIMMDEEQDELMEGSTKLGMEGYFPKKYPQIEKHYMNKFTEGIGDRSPHSFRHSRITHLAQDDECDLSIDEIQRRVGHSDPSTTQTYIETDFRDTNPRMLETYCDDKGEDIEDIILQTDD